MPDQQPVAGGSGADEYAEWLKEGNHRLSSTGASGHRLHCLGTLAEGNCCGNREAHADHFLICHCFDGPPKSDGSGAGSTEQAARAYPVEVEAALNAWIAENDDQGLWVSPAGWWYAGWRHGCSALEAAQGEIAKWSSATPNAADLAAGAEWWARTAIYWRVRHEHYYQSWQIVSADLAQAQASLAKALAVVEAITTYRQAAADAGYPMLPWPALDIALEDLAAGGEVQGAWEKR